MTITPIASVEAVGSLDPVNNVNFTKSIDNGHEPNVSFSQILSNGIDTVSQKAIEADDLVKQFILNDNIPPHRVIYALEQSQLSLQLMLQVRNKLVEGYQEIMRMQL